MLTVPVTCAGATAVRVVALWRTTLVAATPPTVTARAPPATKPLPVMVSGVPPAVGPVCGVTPETVIGAAVATGAMHWPTAFWIFGCSKLTLPGWNTEDAVHPPRWWQ